MSLNFVGLGLEIKDLSLKALDAIKAADTIYGESYTIGISDTTRSELDKQLGREIIWLERKNLEESADHFIKKARNEHIVLLVGGDPFIATTHMAVRLRAVELGIPCHVIHAPSIYSVVGSIGLFNYKFGRSISISFPDLGGYGPSNVPYDVIAKNQLIDAHTLVFLDLNPTQKKFMTIEEGLEILEVLEHKRGENVIDPGMLVVGLARVGTSTAVIQAGSLIQIKQRQFGPPPQAIVIPSSLHFSEAEALVKLWGAPKDLLNSK